jgi:8-oxo-dGTP diphosphatase
MALPFVIAYIENENGEVLIGKQPNKKEKPLPNFWDVPGGKLKSNESPELGITREVKEETGFDIFELELVCIYHNYPEVFHKEYKSDIPSIAICYRASVTGDFKPTEMNFFKFRKKQAIKKLKLTPWTKHLLETMSAI